jgi:arylsulfatase
MQHRINRPNVLLIYTDQQRQDSLGCYGSEFAHTPNIDKLAAQGARFDHYYVNNPVCSPSRMSFLSGRYPGSIGIGCNGIVFPDDVVPLNRMLSPYNYETAQIGKLHFDPHSRREHRIPTDDYGFDTFILSDEPGCYDDAYLKWVESVAGSEEMEKVRLSMPPEALKHRGLPLDSVKPRAPHNPYLFPADESLTHSSFVAAQTCEYLGQSGNKPFFAIAGFYAPHCPIDPPERFLELIDESKLPPRRVGENEGIDQIIKDVTDDQWSAIAKHYYALVAHVDDCVGQILKALEASGKADDTIVIFTTDHGEFLGDHGRVGKGMPGHDCINRVPFIVRYPGAVAPDTVIDALTEGVDFVPTILDYCGVQIPPYVQGKSLKPLLEKRQTELRDDILIEYFHPYNANCAATVKTKSCTYYCPAQGSELLFDRKSDPYELDTVHDDPAYDNVLTDMRRRLAVRKMQTQFTVRERPAQY